MGNLQTLYVKLPTEATEWWSKIGDSNFIGPKVDGWTFVMTVNARAKKQASVDLQEVLDHWDGLSYAHWIIREWNMNPCVGIDFTNIPILKERAICAEEARNLVTTKL